MEPVTTITSKTVVLDLDSRAFVQADRARFSVAVLQPEASTALCLG